MAPDVRLPGRRLRGHRCRRGRRGFDGLPADDASIRWIDERGEACESTRFAQRSAAPIVLRQFLEPSDSRLWRVLGLLRRGVPQEVVRAATGISPWFLAEMGRNVGARGGRARGRARASSTPRTTDGAALLATAKRAALRGPGPRRARRGAGGGGPRRARRPLGLVPGYAMVDTCAAEFAAETPYFYSTYASAGSPPEAPPVARPAALVIGSGPVRIGQGIEFDYCAVQAADVLRREGWSAVMVNSNPETVSTDFDASTRLYFEPLDPESVRSIVEFESGGHRAPHAGRRAADLLPAVGRVRRPDAAQPRRAAGGRRACRCSGSDLEAIDQAEERTRFSALLDRLGIPQPEGGMAESIEEALTLAERIGYPVIVRPSFVIGGLAIDFAYSPEDLARHLAAAAIVDPDRPVRIDRFLEGIEVDVDAVCDGHGRAHPGPARARRARGRPLGRLDRRVPAPARRRGRPAT